ncbi:hypothetical protein [Paenibacillus sp. SN-8-1]|uniref:hypothetical protein n=1 Tax=Paenibacillus sp. SN-8-1 TaxID=3435409 RepID=UPI003D9A1AA9
MVQIKKSEGNSDRKDDLSAERAKLYSLKWDPAHSQRRGRNRPEEAKRSPLPSDFYH